jgi:cation transport ATPase
MMVAAASTIAISAAQEAIVAIFLFAVGEPLETVTEGRARTGIKALINLRAGRRRTSAPERYLTLLSASCQELPAKCQDGARIVATA